MFKCPKCDYKGKTVSDIGAHLNANHRGTSYKQSDIKIVEKTVKANVNKSDSRIDSDEDYADTGN